MLMLNGASGEGGGQILRTALSLAIITQQPVRIEHVRANRARPGLQRQHLTAVQAAARICDGRLEGASLHARAFTFWPGPLHPGDFEFDIGTAGSTSLVLQTILPPLLMANKPTSVTLIGGTHNPLAPTWDFLDRCYFPTLRRLGYQVTGTIEQHGFYPQGGGRIKVLVEPATELVPLQLVGRGPISAIRAKAIVANLPEHIGLRELQVLKGSFELTDATIEQPSCHGSGNALILDVESPHMNAVLSAIGQRGLRAEQVASSLAQEAHRYLQSGATVDEHLADQLLLPVLMAGGGSFLTTKPSLHTTTNMETIRAFSAASFVVEPVNDSSDYIHIRGTL